MFEKYILSAILFLICSLIFFCVNIFLVSLLYKSWRKKKPGPAMVLLPIFLIFNLGFFFIAQRSLAGNANAASKTAVESKIPDSGPVKRVYPFIKNHEIARDEKPGMISAVDCDGESLVLRRDNPRQVYPESFTILMTKENKTFPDSKSALEYAKFIILMYYGESGPVYASSAEELGRNLEAKNNPTIKKIGEDILAVAKKSKSSLKPQAPLEADWDTDGNRMKFGGSGAERVISGISPPDFLTDYDGGKLFRIYTFSLRYKELIEWHFKVFKNGEVWLKKTNEVAF